MRILVLEDDPRRISIFQETLRAHEVEFATTSRGAIDFLAGHRYDVVFLDHDLGGEVWVDPQEKNTGSEVVRWIIGWYNGEKDDRGRFVYPLAPKSWNGTLFIIHSLNSVASPIMAADLRKARCQAKEVPFTILKDKLSDFAHA